MRFTFSGRTARIPAIVRLAQAEFANTIAAREEPYGAHCLLI
jgi:hypothetical protein